MTQYKYITVEYSHQGKIATVTLRQPDVHNAFNPQLVQDLCEAFAGLAQDERLHGAVLAAEGKSFSAGADIAAMKAASMLNESENIQEALRIADLLRAISSLPCPVVARVQGNAIGGGVGLVAASDIAIVAENTYFAFSEVQLGIAPAVISRYVLRKIGESQGRALFVTGTRFTAARAYAIGLIHEVVPTERLDEAVRETVQALLSGGPKALRACKTLAMTVGQMDITQARAYTAEMIARLRVSDEGQEGLSAFLEKRLPRWRQSGE